MQRDVTFKVPVFKPSNCFSFCCHLTPPQTTFIRKVASKDGEIPIKDIEMEVDQKTINVVLWREAALKAIQPGENIMLTHLKGVKHRQYGFKLNSSSFTEIVVRS